MTTVPARNEALDGAWVDDVVARLPIVRDHALIELVNGIGVTRDLTRRPRPLLRRVADTLIGREARRRDIVDGNLVAGQAIVVEWLEGLTAAHTISNLALVEVQAELARLTDATDQLVEVTAELGQAANLLEARLEPRLARIEHDVDKVVAAQEVQFVLDGWDAGRTYSGLPWPLQVMLVAHAGYSEGIWGFERLHGPDPRLRQNLVDRIVARLQHLPTTFFATAALLEHVVATVDPRDREVLVALAADDTPFGQERLRHPHLFVLASALADDRPGPGRASLTRGDHLVGRIPRTTDVRTFVEYVVEETAEAALAASAAVPAATPPVPAPSRQAVPRVAPRVRRRPGSPEVVEVDNPATEAKLGLVLAGGGGRGAYEMGALEALRDLGLRPAAIAGASIGALNGVVAAAAPSFAAGVTSLRRLWDEVAALTSDGSMDDADLVDQDQGAEPEALTERLAALARRRRPPILKPQFLERLVYEHVDVDLLMAGPDVWVTIFPALQGAPAGLGWLADIGLGYLGAGASWQRVQDYFPSRRALEVVLASAALPGVHPARWVHGLPFRDGGLGNNLPIEPLVEAGCTHVVVVHLREAEVWDAHRYDPVEVIEVRPQAPVMPPGAFGGLRSLVDFRPATVERLRRQGYRDCWCILNDLQDKATTVRLHARSIDLLRAPFGPASPDNGR